LQQTASQQFSEALESLRAKATSASIELQTAVTVGAASQQIISRADELKADHIAVGQRVKGSRTSVGSVSLRVATRGLRTVTVVR
jgi:nucleotide-binding universal stress UspA family protein